MELLDDEPAERNLVLSRFFSRVLFAGFPCLLYRFGPVSIAVVDLSHIWDKCLNGVRSSLDDKQCRTAFLSKGFTCLVLAGWARDLPVRDLAICSDDGKARRVRSYLTRTVFLGKRDSSRNFGQLSVFRL